MAKTKDRVTPEIARDAGNRFEGMVSNYGGPASNVVRMFKQPKIKELFYSFIDEHGWDPTNELEAARRFYQKFLGFDCSDLSDIPVPSPAPGFNWLLPIVAIDNKAPIEALYRALSKQFRCWRSTEKILDEVVTTNTRDSRQGSYVIRLRDRVEADEELKNLSANDLDSRQLTVVTLYERMVLEGWYYAKTGKHLDIKNVTLCAGSRAVDGHVPDAHWNSDDSMFCVSAAWCHPDYRSDGLRGRQVVSI